MPGCLTVNKFRHVHAAERFGRLPPPNASRRATTNSRLFEQVYCNHYLSMFGKEFPSSRISRSKEPGNFFQGTEAKPMIEVPLWMKPKQFLRKIAESTELFLLEAICRRWDRPWPHLTPAFPSRDPERIRLEKSQCERQLALALKFYTAPVNSRDDDNSDLKLLYW